MKTRLFTLVELLVTIGVIALLAGMLLSGVSRAREMGKKASCANNLKQITLANAQYATTYLAFCPGRAGGYYTGQHWEGNRSASTDPWDASKGPLVEYLGASGKVKLCPAATGLTTTSDSNTKNLGAGGYGYNFTGVGSKAYFVGYTSANSNSADLWGTGLPPEKIEDPSRTAMFGDVAHLYNGELVEADELMVPYSLYNATSDKLKTKKPTGTVNVAKIHFRHTKTANISWVDGHVSGEQPSYYAPGGSDDDREKVLLGFFGPEDNSLYDPWTDNIPES